MNVEMTAKIHVPVEQYGYVEVEYKAPIESPDQLETFNLVFIAN